MLGPYRDVMNNTVLFQRAEGLAILVTSIYFYFRQKGSIWMFLLLLLVPDICMIGYLWGNKIGAMVYNLGHTLVFPILLLVTGVVIQQNLVVLLSLIWLAHIGMDRALGYGLKSTEGFEHTHLGIIGKHKK